MRSRGFPVKLGRAGSRGCQSSLTQARPDAGPGHGAWIGPGRQSAFHYVAGSSGPSRDAAAVQKNRRFLIPSPAGCRY